jgi:energy-coupling factor transporter ATP-binding protein EcfA2
MSILKSVSIKGVWGERDFDCTFRPDINFLIGANGSGKTTVIDLLAAALTGDYDALVRTPFSSIECELTPEGNSKQSPKIKVERNDQETPAPTFTYALDIPGGKKQYELFPSASMAYRIRLSGKIRGLAGREELAAALMGLVRVKWLSVYRSPGKADPEDRPRGESSVDRRLYILNNLLVRHFSKLAGLKEEATNYFLSRVFLALLYKGGKDDPLQVARSVNIKKLREAMEAIFHQFKIDDEDSMRELKEFMDLAQKSSKKTNFQWSELQTLVGVLPIVRVVEEWNLTLSKQAEILMPQNDFLHIINSLDSAKFSAFQA